MSNFIFIIVLIPTIIRPRIHLLMTCRSLTWCLESRGTRRRRMHQFRRDDISYIPKSSDWSALGAAHTTKEAMILSLHSDDTWISAPLHWWAPIPSKLGFLYLSQERRRPVREDIACWVTRKQKRNQLFSTVRCFQIICKYSHRLTQRTYNRKHCLPPSMTVFMKKWCYTAWEEQDIWMEHMHK